MTYVAKLYVDTVNIIHFMHDKYAYEASQFALHDTNLERIAAYGIAGLSIAADSLSAIKYATVKPIRNENGVAIDFETIGDFPKYGNDDDRADDLAVNTVTFFSDELKKHPIYRNAIHTLSALTITSNGIANNRKFRQKGENNEHKNGIDRDFRFCRDHIWTSSPPFSCISGRKRASRSDQTIRNGVAIFDHGSTDRVLPERCRG